MWRAVPTTSSPSRPSASDSAVYAGMYSASTTTGGASGSGDEHVGPETGLVDDLPGVLIENGVLGQHTAKQGAEGVVGVLLSLLGHWDGTRVGADWIIQPF